MSIASMMINVNGVDLAGSLTSSVSADHFIPAALSGTTLTIEATAIDSNGQVSTITRSLAVIAFEVTTISSVASVGSPLNPLVASINIGQTINISGSNFDLPGTLFNISKNGGGIVTLPLSNIVIDEITVLLRPAWQLIVCLQKR